MLFSTPTSEVTKIIEPGETLFYLHCMAIPSKGKFKRVAEVHVKQVINNN